MTVEMHINVYGEDLIRRRLLRVGDRVKDMGPGFDQAALQIMGMEEQLFNSGGASSGRTWPPIEQETLDRKIRAGLDPRVLHATLRLRRSLTQPGAPGQIAVAGFDRLTFGTTVPYARFHQLGQGGLPRRRPLDFSEADKRNLVKGLQRYAITGELEKLR